MINKKQNNTKTMMPNLITDYLKIYFSVTHTKHDNQELNLPNPELF